MVSLFHCETMQHVSLFMRFDDAPMVSVVLAQSGFFDPSRASSKDKNLPDQQGISYRRIFNLALSDWKKTTEYLSITPLTHVKEIFPVNKHHLMEIEKQIADIWKTCVEHKEQKRLLDNQLNSLLHLFKLLDHFSNLDINLNLLKKKLKFLDVHLGIIPIAYISRLKQALAIEGYYLSVYIQEGDSAHVIVAGVKQTTDSIQLLLESASFQKLKIPEEFHEHPKIVNEKLTKKHQQLLKQIADIEQEHVFLKEKYSQELIVLGELLTLAKPYAVLSQEMLRNGQLIKIDGWVPVSKMQLIQTLLDKNIKDPIVVEVREPKSEEYAKTPSYLLRPEWLNPFINLIANFGVPGYREFDPSWFFTLSYMLMFGIMFGDVGHGLCLISLSWMMRNKWPEYFTFFLSTGLSSLFFGFIYGSIFSYEHVLPALWLSPIENPMLMLKLSLFWGAIFIVFLNLISIYNRLLNMPLKEVLFNPHGFTGLLLYIAILWAVFNFSLHQLSDLNLWFIMILLVVIFSYHWQNDNSQTSERFLISLIKTYDVIIGYFSNTVSFLRVAAFTLNHSALAIALFTMAEMTDGGWHWTTIILGNLFILVLEGAIVAIQVLRLEYYEGFSRFFTGDGYLFKPLELSPLKLL